CFRFNSFLDQLNDVVMCPGGQVLLDVSGGERYEWTPTTSLDDPTAPSVIASPDTTTTYAVRIFDECNIPLFDTATVVVAGDSVFFDLGPDTTLCEGEGLRVDVTTPTARYEWSDSTLSGPTPILVGADTYSVTVTRTDTFCTAADRVQIDYRPFPVLDLGPDTTLCRGELFPLIAVFPEATAFLDDGTPFDTLYVSRTGLYSAVMLHPCGTALDRVAVTFENCHEVYLPNAFTPNGDGVNDAFFPMDGGDVIIIHQLHLFDRWGNLVFEQFEFSTNRAELGWDGTIDGKLAPSGTYIYQMESSFIDGSQLTTKGSVQLIR
ncbi:MAG: gliding motility-associated C-terminal domain-containing protein, partial [Bacteroidota bacterium]